MSDTRTSEEIRADIEHTREELADTAAELAQRADVKARTHEKVEETKAKMSHKVDEAKAQPQRLGLAIAVVAGLVIGLIVMRRRR
jgi:tetrahydromethanopterin S-methyltransferase subunit G